MKAVKSKNTIRIITLSLFTLFSTQAFSQIQISSLNTHKLSADTLHSPLISHSSEPSIMYKGLRFSSPADHLGFFCKQENKINKVSQVQFKFRLGSVLYVDRLESKPYTKYLID